LGKPYGIIIWYYWEHLGEQLGEQIGKRGVLSLWPTYIGEKGRTLGKTYGIKARCYWEHPWGTHLEPREHIENLMRTHWELRGTCWEQRKNEKPSAPPKLLVIVI